MDFEAVIVGSGPNGLGAAIEIARAGHSVCVIEAAGTVGGGARSAELTLPGFTHDICSAVHPLAISSPFFRSLPLADHGLKWAQPAAALAHPFDDGTAAILERSIEKTCLTLGQDGPAYSKFFSPLVRRWERLLPEILAPPLHVPKHPVLLAGFGLHAMQSAQGFAQRHFKGPRARALFAGIAGHSNMPLEASPTAAFGLLLGMLGHGLGWPVVRGGSQKLSDALSSYLKSIGGQIITFRHVKSLRELPSARATLLDVAPRQVLRLAGDRLPPGYRYELEKYRHGAGVFKVDWALNSPIPWKAKQCSRAGSIHLGGLLEEMAASEQMVAQGRPPDRPLVILSQPSLFDDTRAPAGRHTAWAYCHVPNGSKIDMTAPIEAQVERFAPGFRDCIAGRHIMSTADFETYNPNYIGGDISGGLQNRWQIVARPALRWNPYTTPVKGLYICSSSTPPGGGVHGMCGYHAARAALTTVLYNPR